jgi:CheY-like chemotaxis protein
MPKVLVVDDSVQIRDVVTRTLTAAGFTVLRAMDQLGAVKTATAEWPDVVLLDFSVSERGDAWEIWDALARVGGGRPLRVVLYSAEMTDVERSQAYRRGAAAILDKVIAGRPLAAALKQAMTDSQ